MKIITPTKGMMIRQQLMQLFGEASQWPSLVDASKLPAPHSSASQLGKHLHEMAQTQNCLDHQKRWLFESNKLDSELLVITPTNQLSVMTSSAIAPPPCDNEGGSTETRPAPSPYSDSNVLMGNIDDSVTNDLYQ